MRIPSVLTPSMSNQGARRHQGNRAGGLAIVALAALLGAALAKAEGLRVERLAVPGDIKSINQRIGAAWW